MRIKTLAASAILSLSALSTQAQATTIDFDDLATPLGGGTIGYLSTAYGLTWTGIYDDYSVVISPNTSSVFGGGDTAHSGINFAWSNGSTEFAIIGTAFTFNSIWIRTPWATAPLEVKGFKDGVEIYSVSTTATGTYQHLVFDFVDIDKVTFSGENSGNLLFDDVVVNEVPAVPEPETYGMLLAGLGILGIAARRKRTAA